LTKQEELIRLLLENLAEAVFACDAEGKLTLKNRTVREWCCGRGKAPVEEAAGLYEVYESDGVTPVPAEKTPLRRALKGERVRDMEICIVSHGKHRYVMANGGPLLDAEGRKQGAMMAMHDITEIRQHARRLSDLYVKLEHSNDRLRNQQEGLKRLVAHSGEYQGDLSRALQMITQTKPLMSQKY